MSAAPTITTNHGCGTSAWVGADAWSATGGSEGPETPADQRIDVRTALLAVAAQQRACIAVRFHDDLTVPEIRDRLGLADGTLKRSLSVGVRRMEGLLGPLGRPQHDAVVLVRHGGER